MACFLLLNRTNELSNIVLKNTCQKSKTMNRYGQFYKTILLLVIIPLFFMQSVRSEIPEGIINAISSGNSGALAGYFNSSLEVTILDKEDFYSKQQAELIMKDFFTRNKPASFTILHKGGKEGSQYAIGRLVTSGGSYRVTILVKMKENKVLIHQLRFEKDEE